MARSAFWAARTTYTPASALRDRAKADTLAAGTSHPCARDGLIRLLLNRQLPRGYRAEGCVAHPNTLQNSMIDDAHFDGTRCSDTASWVVWVRG